MSKKSIVTIIKEELAREGAKIVGASIKEYVRQIGRRAGQNTADALFKKNENKPLVMVTSMGQLQEAQSSAVKQLAEKQKVDNGMAAQVVNAMVKLGFKRQEAALAAMAVGDELESMPPEEALRAALSKANLPNQK